MFLSLLILSSLGGPLGLSTLCDTRPTSPLLGKLGMLHMEEGLKVIQFDSIKVDIKVIIIFFVLFNPPQLFPYRKFLLLEALDRAFWENEV